MINCYNSQSSVLDGFDFKFIIDNIFCSCSCSLDNTLMSPLMVIVINPRSIKSHILDVKIKLINYCMVIYLCGNQS